MIDAWLACPARDTEGKEYYWQLCKNTKRLKAILIGYVEGGKAAKAEMQSPKPGVLNYFRRK